MDTGTDDRANERDGGAFGVSGAGGSHGVGADASDVGEAGTSGVNERGEAGASDAGAGDAGAGEGGEGGGGEAGTSGVNERGAGAVGGRVADELRGAGAASAPGDPSERFRDAAKRAIEAMVMVAEEPMPPHLLAQLLEISPVVVDALCRELAEGYEAEQRGFELLRVAGGWRYQSHPDQAAYVERLVLEGQSSKLSAAALETLAIVAYKQPISRAQVAAIRGVSVDGVMRTLQQRGLIVELGKDPGPGQAVMFGTSASFLVKLGLNGLEELPPLGDFVPDANVVEQLERGLRPDRQVLRPEDAIAGAPPPAPADSNGASGYHLHLADADADTDADTDPFGTGDLRDAGERDDDLDDGV